MIGEGWELTVFFFFYKEEVRIGGLWSNRLSLAALSVDVSPVDILPAYSVFLSDLE